MIYKKRHKSAIEIYFCQFFVFQSVRAQKKEKKTISVNFIDFKHETSGNLYFNAKLCISQLKIMVSMKNSL